jgi:hypothetical protein
MRLRCLVITVALAACGDDGPLSNATSLECPAPGTPLPFHLQSHGFQNDPNRTLASTDTRIKDEAGDTIGNPGGAQANVYLADDANPSASPIAYHGDKARTTETNGLTAQPLGGENVSLWFYDQDAMKWQMVARTKTDDTGYYDVADSGFVAPNGEPVYSMLEADGSCAIHRDFLMAAGSKFVVFDIDGTLTTDDNQILMQVADGSYVPMMMTAGNTLVQTWAAKGYPVVYLTARTHVFDAESREWLDMLQFPDGPLITANGGSSADVYKTKWLQRMASDFGWVPYAAYGNAITDITAYENAGIAKDHTFIIGPEGGMMGTVAIPNMDYTQHIQTFVNAQPDNH